MRGLEYYLIIINIIGFILFAVNTWLYSNTAERQVDKFLTIASLLGGSLGILISIFIFDRKAVKGNMMSRVFVSCVFVIQVVIFLFLKGVHGERLTFAFWEFFAKYKFILVCLGIINFVTFAVFAVDKIAAIEKNQELELLRYWDYVLSVGLLVVLEQCICFITRPIKSRMIFLW